MKRTTVRSKDERVAGPYEQTGDWPSPEMLYAAAARRIGTGFAVSVEGRVDRPHTFMYDDLAAMAAVFDEEFVAVRLVDLLAAVRLDHSAGVLVATSFTGVILGVPVSDVITADRAVLSLGTVRDTLPLHLGFPVRLDVPDWTEPDRPFRPMSIRACTFEEFITCT